MAGVIRRRCKRSGGLRFRLHPVELSRPGSLIRPTNCRSRTCECIPIPVLSTSLILIASCSRERGARERHGRGAGCGGRGSVRLEGSDGAEPAGSVSCKPDADVRRWRGRLRRVVLMPRVASSPGGEPDPTGKGNPQSVTTATKSVSAAGEQRDRPLKPLRAERWEAGVSVVTNSCALFFCTRGCGCTGRPAFRTPSFQRGWDVHWQSSGAWRREIANPWLFEI
jgi:hypothetical protein